MSSNFKILKAIANKVWADKEWMEAHAENFQPREDVPAFLEDLQARLKNAPKSVHDEFFHVINSRSKEAYQALANGDDTKLKQALFILSQNFHRLNLDTEIVNRHEGNKTGGKADKRSHWAEDLADYLAGLDVSFPKAWKHIPEDENNPLELDEDTAVYRTDEGEKVVAFDLLNRGEIKLLARSTFEKHYFRKAKNKADSN
jgi:hypothetical protein